MSVNEQSRIASMLRGFVDDMLYDVQTNIPAVVTSVNYGNGTLSAKPLIKTKKKGGQMYEEPMVHDVPILTAAGNTGKAKMTFPIKVGDKVVLIMANRDTGTLLNSSGGSIVEPEMDKPLGWYPIGAHACLFVEADTNDIDPENIIIKNDKAKFTITNSSTKIETAGGSAELKASGELNVNGAKISPDGQITTASGVNLDLFFQDYNLHKHSGVQTGSSNTGTKV
jgi:hypothetical protein